MTSDLDELDRMLIADGSELNWQAAQAIRELRDQLKAIEGQLSRNDASLAVASVRAILRPPGER